MSWWVDGLNRWVDGLMGWIDGLVGWGEVMSIIWHALGQRPGEFLNSTPVCTISIYIYIFFFFLFFSARGYSYVVAFSRRQNGSWKWPKFERLADRNLWCAACLRCDRPTYENKPDIYILYIYAHVVGWDMCSTSYRITYNKSCMRVYLFRLACCSSPLQPKVTARWRCVWCRWCFKYCGDVHRCVPFLQRGYDMRIVCKLCLFAFGVQVWCAYASRNLETALLGGPASSEVSHQCKCRLQVVCMHAYLCWGVRFRNHGVRSLFFFLWCRTCLCKPRHVSRCKHSCLQPFSQPFGSHCSYTQLPCDFTRSSRQQHRH